MGTHRRLPARHRHQRHLHRPRLFDPRGRVRFGKLLTTPDDPLRGLLDGMRAVLAEGGVLARALAHALHGTTHVFAGGVEARRWSLWRGAGPSRRETRGPGSRGAVDAGRGRDVGEAGPARRASASRRGARGPRPW
ncbi:MAG: hypothetical protein HYV62_04370 [Candidatus Rokubacteria bacterium]|nr:hypothetical protein [Candidatus Rokubacteria bacterium]